MNNKFTQFIAPVLKTVDDGRFFRKPMSWLYYLMAVINLLIPLFILYQAIDNKLFSGGFKFVIAFILIFLFVTAAAWIGFQIWWDRKDKVTQTSGERDEFVSTPVFTHFLKTFGEWLGSFYAIAGFGIALIGSLFLGGGSIPGLDMIGGGWPAVIINPLTGYLIIVLFRFVAEQARALVQIANNTKK
ncbi:MAG: hypothetical protein ACLFM1_04180 [Bacteroidales bacterium]